MKIEFIDQNNKYLNDVIALWRRHSNTLGFMPDGAFSDHAKNHNIVIAHENSKLLGYLMFRVVHRYSRITIVHLCTDEQLRRNGTAKKLLDKLVEKYQSTFYGICLRCRDDYVIANSLWKKYGFVCRNKARSKSAKENYLNLWWYDFNRPDLFSSVYQFSKIKVLLDANVLFKLRDFHIENHTSDDISPLLIDWLIDEVDFFYAPETFNEILRDKSLNRAEKTRRYLGKYIEARSNVKERKDIVIQLKEVINGDNENDESDRNQLAACIISEISYFITLDKELLQKGNDLENKFGIRIFTPQEFVLEIDQLISKEVYAPRMLDGVVFHTVAKVKNFELNNYIDLFLMKSKAEKKVVFQNIVNNEIANQNSNLQVIKSENTPVAFYSYTRKENTLTVPFIRLQEKKYKQTLFMQIISGLIRDATGNNISKIAISDDYFSDGQKLTLLRLGFENESSKWTKLIFDTMLDSNDVGILGNNFLESILKTKIEKRNSREYHDLLLILERKYFPLKFTDLDIPCYIIPIKAYWAGQLFDMNVSGELLFGANPNKIWNIENVYFRHAKPLTEIAPARILWYISFDKDIIRSKAIVASSYLDEVVTDKPKIVFKNYNHYGVYEWRDIFCLCNKNIKTNIRALRFSGTEVFEKPISYQAIQNILTRNGKPRNTFVSPLRINTTIFNQIYRMGTCKI
jgi:predicted nucleic acid-binding protein/ribosomal protein S18 acetylase RimI-like enzyme